MDGQANSDSLRVASFSAYLNPTDNNLVLKLTGGVSDPALDIFSPGETPRLVPNKAIRATREGDIGVFGADKYFNMKLGYHSTPTNSETRDGDKIEVYHYLSPNLGTPTVTSQSSWNSHSLLLKTPNKPKKVTRKGFFSGFSCNGPCLDKKAVHVNESGQNCLVQKKGSHHALKKPQIEEKFEFPIPKSMKEKEEEEEEPRRSIEVFGSQMNKKIGDIATNLERKLSMLTWDAIPKSQKSSASTMVGISGPCDDIHSDASSDLFEIDPLSGTGYPLVAIHPLEDQYEPSEASIEWSVVTASAVDFSVASDYDEKLVSGSRNRTSSRMEKTKKETQKSRPGGLLGCKDHKAVGVAEAAYRTNEKARVFMERKDFEFLPLGQRSFGNRVIKSQAL